MNGGGRSRMRAGLCRKFLKTAENTGEIALNGLNSDLRIVKSADLLGFLSKIDTKYQGIFFEITGDEL